MREEVAMKINLPESRVQVRRGGNFVEVTPRTLVARIEENDTGGGSGSVSRYRGVAVSARSPRSVDSIDLPNARVSWIAGVNRVSSSPRERANDRNESVFTGIVSSSKASTSGAFLRSVKKRSVFVDGGFRTIRERNVFHR